jgi:hypothetical protein
VVAVAALYEGHTHHNLFDHMNHWLPILRESNEPGAKLRLGGLRVRASAQHPIALAAALTLALPLVLYLSSRASTKLRSRLWQAVSLLLVAGAVATISRTAILMLIAVLVVGLALRGRALFRRWPLLLLLLAATHFSAPGAIKHLYHSFTPKGGLIQQQEVRSGQSGSGRVADLTPGFHRWAKKPLLGTGLGTNPTLADPLLLQTQDPGAPVPEGTIYDDQWLSTLIALGLFGIVGTVWFVWGAVKKILGAGRRAAGRESDLLVACGASCAAFAVGMFTFDAFSFVQPTIFFFMIAGLGLRARRLEER